MLFVDATRESLLLSLLLAAVVVGIGLWRYRLHHPAPLEHDVEVRAELLEEDAEGHSHNA